MAKPFKLRELEEQRGDLHKVIPPLVNAHGQAAAALELGTSQATISNWLKDHSYKKVVTYLREPVE